MGSSPDGVHPRSPLLHVLSVCTSIMCDSRPPPPVHTDAFPPGSERVKSDSACTEQPSLPRLSLSIHFYLERESVCVVLGGPVPSASPVDL